MVTKAKTGLSNKAAEALANQHGKGKIVALSAGVRLADRVNPLMVEAMKEKGIDVSTNRPKLLMKKMVEEADQVVTMGCSVEEVCPAPLIRDVVDWELEDPKGKSMQKVREIRDEIEQKVLALIAET